MDFGQFIRTISKAKVFKENTLGIVLKFFEKADSFVKIIEATANSWVYPRGGKGGPPKHFRTYFPKDKIDETRLFNFISKELHGDKWKKLQQEFQNANYEGVIDCETENKDIFIHSLISQFKVLLHLPPSNESATKSHKGQHSDDVFDNASINSEIADWDIHSISKQSEELLEKFIRAAVKHDIVECINQGSRGYKEKFLAALKDALDIYISNNDDEKSSSYYVFLLINNFNKVFDDYIYLSKSNDYDMSEEVKNQRLQLTDILRNICRNHEVSREFYPAFDLDQTLEIIASEYKIKSQGK